MRVKNETSRWYWPSSSTTARSKSALKMSRTTRTERSASWKTSDGARLLLDAPLEHLVELEEVRQLALEVRARGAVGGGAHDRAAAVEVQALDLLAQPLALLVVEALGDADALAGRRVDHVAPGDRQLHREPRALGLERVLDDLDDDLLARLEDVADALAALLPAPAARDVDARQHDLVDVQEAVLLEPDVDERRLEPVEHVVDAALVDVADDRAAAAALEIELRDAVARRRVLGARAPARRPRAGVPACSSIATRVSHGSTLTITCFFTVGPSVWAWKAGMPAPSGEVLKAGRIAPPFDAAAERPCA